MGHRRQVRARPAEDGALQVLQRVGFLFSGEGRRFGARQLQPEERARVGCDPRQIVPQRRLRQEREMFGPIGLRRRGEALPLQAERLRAPDADPRFRRIGRVFYSSVLYIQKAK